MSRQNPGASRHVGASRWCDGDEGDWCDPRGEKVAYCRTCGKTGYVIAGLCPVCTIDEEAE